MRKIYFKPLSQPVYQILAIATLILFLSSSLRHALFKSNAYDLGIFDQAVYLISQGLPPFSSLMGYHILGDHAAWIFYLLAIPYKIYPTVHWLLLIQALAFVSGAVILWKLANLADLPENKSVALILVYLLYPAVFNINLFDFHPEVIALPLFLTAVLTARKQNILSFSLSILFILGCKEILALTVIALGFWLLFLEKRKTYGMIAILAGVVWFLIATQLIIPYYTHGQPAAINRYSFLGNSVLEITQNILLKPWLIFRNIFTSQNLEYLAFLFLPILWAISFKSLPFLWPVIPALALNLITDDQPQKDLVHHYSIPILPFLMLSVLATLQVNGGWLKKPKYIIIWSLIFFLILGKYTFFTSMYLNSLDTWQATREAISMINNKGPVLAWTEIIPHLSQRPIINMALTESKLDNLQQFEHILLNLRHPGWLSSTETISNLISRIEKEPNFKLNYHKDDVFLFQKQ